MREMRNRKAGGQVRFPLIKDKASQPAASSTNKGIKLERIGQKKNLMVLDIANINKIEKEFTNMTKRINKSEDQSHPSRD